jgi:translocation and assembly module TamB
MKRWKSWLLTLLVLLLLVPATLLVMVVTTERGLRMATGTVDRIGRLGPITIRITDVSGTLARGAHFGHVEIHHRNAEIVAQDIRGRLELLPLLARRINVRDAHVTDVSIVEHPVRRDGPAITPRFLAPLMRLHVADARIDRLLLTMANGVKHEATGIAATVTILPKEIRVRQAQAELPALATRIAANGRLIAHAPIAFDGHIDIDYAPENLPAWRIAADFDGDLDKLPLQVAISAPFHARFDGAAHTLNAGWRVAGKATVSDFDLVVFGGGHALGLVSGTLDVSADATGFNASGSVEPAGLKAGPFDVVFSGQYHARQLDIREASVLHPPSRTRFTASGNVKLHEGGGQHLRLEGEWDHFRWPLVGEPAAFHSERGRYSIEGDKPWQVVASGMLEAGGLPSTPFEVAGTLEPQRFVISRAQLDALQGRVQLTGDARWAPAESWRVEGQARGINPATLRPDLPGRIDFGFAANGAPFGERAALSVAISGLRGQLRNQELRGGGRISRTAGNPDFRFDGVDVRLGRTQLQLDGVLGTGSRDLRFVVNAEDLSLADPEARGKLNARGRFAGTTQAPLLELDATGSGFEWREFRIDSLSADIDVDFGAGQRTNGAVHMQGLRAAGRDFQQINLSLKGTPSAQRIGVEMSAQPVQLAATASGSVTAGTFNGKIDSLTLKDDRDLHLRLEHAALVSASTGAASISELCLVGSEARLCADGKFDANSWNAGFKATQLPLAALTAGLTSEVDYNGTIDIAASARGGAGLKPVGELRAQLTGAELQHQLTNGRVERMSFGSGEVVIIAVEEALDLNVGLDSDRSGNLTGKLHIDRTAGDWRDHPISGKLDLSTDGLGVLDIYLGGIDRASGRLVAKVGINGTLGAPTIEGLLQLRNAQIDIFQVNLSMRDLTLDASFDTNRLELTGHSALGEGTMNFSGNLVWRDREPYGQLKISGENLLVADVPEARIHASPDLDFRINGRRIDVTGKVLLPDVRLQPADLTNAALASNDEVIVGAPKVDPALRWIVVSDIRVELGNQVHIDAFGLTGRLGGALNVRTDEFQVTRGQGELGVVEGQYAAFGRRLDITRGRLIFNNEQLGDPGIDLRAQRDFPDVLAGVNVRGTLRTPRMTFFSEPSLPQWQIASLLFAGGTLQSAQNSSAQRAASGVLLAQGGAILAQRYGSEIGIQDVSLETNLNDESSLVLGRYLSPRLYISYGISLTEAINTLRLRYTISDRWTLRIESGSAQSADLDYTIFR